MISSTYGKINIQEQLKIIKVNSDNTSLRKND